MHSSRHPSSRTPGRLTVLAIAIASALAAGQASATPPAIGLNNSTPLPSLNNPLGTSINGGVNGIVNSSSIGTLSNSGTVSGGSGGIYNSGTITSLNNETGGTVSGGDTGISNGGNIGTLSNSGTIHGGSSSGVYNYGSIGTLSNSGSISSDTNGVANFGTLTLLNNETGGTISGGLVGIYNGGAATLSSLNNETGGIISGGRTGIYNAGSIGTLNNSGFITGNLYALYNISAATLGTVTNAGTIAGAIRNDAAQSLTINGGTGSVFGILTGAGDGSVSTSNIGQITNSFSNLVFGSGNLLLNDNITVLGDPTHTVSNLAATLQVNNTIHINGNYQQGANASLILGVADNAVTTGNVATDSGYGRLVVSGSANIASGSTIGLQKLGSYGFAQGQRYVVIQANSTGTNYNANTLHYTVAGFNAAGTSVADGANSDLLVTLGSTAPLNQATSANGTAPLAGLFHYDGLNADLMNLFNAAAALDSSAAGNHAGAQLSPTANASAATQASTASTVQVLNVAAAHLDGLRTAQNDSVGSGVATGESASNTGLWGQAFGGSSRLGERDDIAGYHARYSGFLLGADAAFNDSWRAGGLFSYTKTTVNNDGDNSGSSADVKSYGLFGYASYQGQPWYLDLSLGAIQHQYDTQREISFSGFNGAAKGQHDGMQYIASAQAGYPIDLGPTLAHTILTPIAGLTYSTLRQDSYTESGGNGAALHLDSSNTTSLKSDLGAKLERSFATSYGSVVPSAQLTWRHEYHDNGLQSVANYAADTSGATSFTSPGAKAIADTGVLALGVTLLHSENLSLGVKYTLEAASGYTANTGDVQVRWNF
ncbi:autotransporter outer membrane beta-barrel domain-containing protein [Pseudomonas gingeri]|uniref:Autotransporter domain-containing protein n=1 Tax=Pseudomonas gingeri TaxID=117681 RepID=A0A7Y8BVK0_9PSED|nr:autotransporter domain-containing protein [Pseudomonas gingeri]NWB89416.1 autotransporter domain-containing protein [Pseudomonas gingeri]